MRTLLHEERRPTSGQVSRRRGGGAVNNHQDGTKDGTELQAWGITGPAEGTLPCVCVRGGRGSYYWVGAASAAAYQPSSATGGGGGWTGGGQVWGWGERAARCSGLGRRDRSRCVLKAQTSRLDGNETRPGTGTAITHTHTHWNTL